MIAQTGFFDITEQEHIISLTGLLARVKVMPRKVEVPLACAIPFNKPLKSSGKHEFVDSRVPLSDFDANLNMWFLTF